MVAGSHAETSLRREKKANRRINEREKVELSVLRRSELSIYFHLLKKQALEIGNYSSPSP